MSQIRRRLDCITSIAVLYRFFSFNAVEHVRETLLTYHLTFLVFPFDERIMYERVEDAHQRVLVIPKQLHRHFARDAEDAFDTRHAQPVDHVLRQTEWDAFRDFQVSSLVCGRA